MQEQEQEQKQQRQKTMIEVGAYDGSDSLRFHQNGYRVFTFEPKKDLYDALVERTKNLPEYTVISKAVCSTNGKTMFNICNSGGASSILSFKSTNELIKHWSSQRTDIHYSGVSYEVETIRLDTFIEEQGLQDTKIDYIHIDAQGVDLECLMSLGKYIKNVAEGVLETVVDVSKSIYVEQKLNTLDNIKKYLSDSGFVITSIQSNDMTGCEYNVSFRRI